MLPIRKARVQLLLVIFAINLVVSCLVTNCPRGGKRGWSGLVSGDVINHEAKRCKLCTAKEGMCVEEICSLSSDCEDEGICVTTEICCSKNHLKRKKGSISKYYNSKTCRDHIKTIQEHHGGFLN